MREDKRFRNDLTKNLLRQEYIDNNLTVKQISEKHNCAPVTVKRYLDKYGIPNGRKDITKIITKNDFHQMYFVDNMSITEICEKHNTVYTGTLLKKVKEWGFEIRRDTRTKRQIKTRGFISSNEHICAAYIRAIRNRAKRKNIDFELDCDFIYDLFVKQDGKCALSGMNILLPKTNKDNYKCLYSATVDRIDSNVGYTKDNVQLLHKDVNRMKYTHSTEYVIELCEKIADYNKEKNL